MRETETSHFWVGRLPESVADAYFVEGPAAPGDPISPFARDQGVEYYDHDFLEYGWGAEETIQQLVEGYSYSDDWGEELAQRVAKAGLREVNFFAFIAADQIQQPRSVQGDGYWLHYLGTIEYAI